MIYLWLLLTLGIAAWAGFAKSWAILAGSFVLFLAGIGASVAWVPAMRDSAAQIAGARAYCLALPGQHRPVQSSFDLTLFVAQGSRLAPHLMLWVDEGETIQPYNWSYRRGEFVPHRQGGIPRNCSPRPEFLVGAPTTEGDGFHFGIGKETYIIPASHEASHNEDRFLRFELTASDALPVETVDIFLNPDAASLLTDGAEGEDMLQFDCDAKENCRLRFVRDSLLFDLRLVEADPERAPEIRRDFEALWNSFRQRN